MKKIIECTSNNVSVCVDEILNIKIISPSFFFSIINIWGRKKKSKMKVINNVCLLFFVLPFVEFSFFFRLQHF